MTLATMADRTLPLADRVQSARLDWDLDDDHRHAWDELLAALERAASVAATAAAREGSGR